MTINELVLKYENDVNKELSEIEKKFLETDFKSPQEFSQTIYNTLIFFDNKRLKLFGELALSFTFSEPYQYRTFWTMCTTTFVDKNKELKEKIKTHSYFPKLVEFEKSQENPLISHLL